MHNACLRVRLIQACTNRVLQPWPRCLTAKFASCAQPCPAFDLDHNHPSPQSQTPPVPLQTFPRLPAMAQHHTTSILPVRPTHLGRITLTPAPEELVDQWHIEWDNSSLDVRNLRRAAREIKETDTPVAFPTETVYGLGADATRSSAVKEIFRAKGRPADNPLIVHFSGVRQLREFLRGSGRRRDGSGNHGEPARGEGITQNGDVSQDGKAATEPGNDPIPEIYKPLIHKFWPGPLTIILPLPTASPLAPEVTASLSTFGARMPRSLLALALIDLAGVPLAAPSANASTRPSPTAAEHVLDDLSGRINTIIDGGPCEVGVESTVVDGLSDPPVILRPGGVSIEELRQCPGWENVIVGYKDAPLENGAQPRAPGMKYRHYSPRATVVLYEAGTAAPGKDSMLQMMKERGCTSFGIIRTKTWEKCLGLPVTPIAPQRDGNGDAISPHLSNGPSSLPEIAVLSSPPGAADLCSSPSHTTTNLLRSVTQHQIPHAHHYSLSLVPAQPDSDSDSPALMDVWDIALGCATEDVARGLFAALRELDKRGVSVIFVEGVDDAEGHVAAAVMNRLRKAAEVRV